MTTNEEYLASVKKVWMIYSAAVVCLIIFLVGVVAGDNEERLFYGIMTAAASYVFRPGDEFIQGAVKRLFNLSPPEQDAPDE